MGYPKPQFEFWASCDADVHRQMAKRTSGLTGCFAINVMGGLVSAWPFARPCDIWDSFLENGQDRFGYYVAGIRHPFSAKRVARAEWKAAQAAYTADR